MEGLLSEGGGAPPLLGREPSHNSGFSFAQPRANHVASSNEKRSGKIPQRNNETRKKTKKKTASFPATSPGSPQFWTGSASASVFSANYSYSQPSISRSYGTQVCDGQSRASTRISALPHPPETLPAVSLHDPIYRTLATTPTVLSRRRQAERDNDDQSAAPTF